MNRYEIALQVLQKLKPEMVPNFDQVGELPAADARIEAPQTGAPLRLEEYIDSVRPLPEMTLLLGKCEDGLPILVDLENPACGSILINSAPEAQGRYLLRTLLASARLLNRGNQVQYSLITSEKSYYGKLAAASQWRHDYHPANRAAGVHILEISALVEQRYSGRRRGPAILVAIDDLEAFARGSMDEEVCCHLEWTVREGPAVGIWSIVVTEPEHVRAANMEFVSQFGTRIFARGRRPRPFELNRRAPDLLMEYPSFEISTGAEVLRFAVPAV